MTNPQLPLISIGMPVRNEARFLKESLDSLLGQIGVRTEIIISDNASTDETESICKHYCISYPQIRYHRFEENVGASSNFSHVLNEAKGEYFIWACGHDLWDSTYLLDWSQVLVPNPHVMMAFGWSGGSVADGEPFPRFTGWYDTRGLTVVGRYCTVFWGNMNPIIGLIRTYDLKLLKIEDMVGIDLAVLLNLVIKGDFAHVWQTAWYRREFRTETTYKQKLQRYNSSEFALSSSLISRYFPLLRLPIRIVTDLFESSLRLREKLMIFQIVLSSIPIKYFVDKAKKTGK
jgi:glycosyltransferase involved in cell wall biosynthesis